MTHLRLLDRVGTGFRTVFLIIFLSWLSQGRAHQIASGFNSGHTLSIKGGSVWAWGNNAYGQLGDGSTTSSVAPVQAVGLTDVVAVAATMVESVALKSDGTVWTWGGMSGNLVPTEVSGLTDIVEISAGNAHILARKNDGTIWGWGSFGWYGEIGNGGGPTWTPVQIYGISGAVSISAGAYHSLAILSDGTVWAWGNNGYGQLGDGTWTNNSYPVQAVDLYGAVSVSGGEEGSFAVTSDGSVWFWGRDPSNNQNLLPTQLSTISGVSSIVAGGVPGGSSAIARKSDGTIWVLSKEVTPTQVITPSSVTDVGTGNDCVFVTLADGNVWSWGWNNFGQLGDYTVSSSNTWLQLLTLGKVLDLDGSQSQALAVKEDGTLWAWGQNQYDMLGDNTNIQRDVPVQVIGLSNVARTSMGGMHSLALKNDGTVWGWGFNGYGQLGDNTTNSPTTPVQASGLTDVVAISAGGSFSLALKSNGTVWAWGGNFNGEVGDNTLIQRKTAVQVSGLTGVVAISAGSAHSLALKSDGTVWAWGGNGAEGRLGDGTTVTRKVPVQVPGLSNMTAVSAGISHSLAVRADGVVFAWGGNQYGQLGNNTTTNSLSPQQVSGLTDVVDVYAGYWHSLAVKSNGDAWGWGYNGAGNLGDNTTTQRKVPVQVAGAKGMVRMTGGIYHSLGLKEDGSVAVWGWSAWGNFGLGVAAMRYNTVLPVLGYNLLHAEPHIAFTNPSPGSTTTVPLGQSKVLQLSVTPGDAAISEVQLRFEGLVLDTVAGSPSSITWTPPTWGDFDLTVVARDANGIYSAPAQEIKLRVPYDSDNDGLPDWWENGYFGNLSATASGDTDNDGASNLQEWTQGTNPFVVDTDGDGLSDGWEWAHRGQFALYPGALEAELYRNATASRNLYLVNDTDQAVQYSITLEGNSQTGYSSTDSLTGSAVFTWEDISSSGTKLQTVSDADDDSEPVSLVGFVFPFYGQNFSTVYVSSNGTISLGSEFHAYQNTALPGSSLPVSLIAPLWRDLNPGDGGDVYYKEETGKLIVQYQAVRKYGSADTYTFQVALYADGRIEMRYLSLTGVADSCTVGIQDLESGSAVQAVYNASYLQNNLCIRFAPDPAVIIPGTQFFAISPLTGTVAAGTTATLTGLFESHSFPSAAYEATIHIATNDPNAPALTLPATLTVVDHPIEVTVLTPDPGARLVDWQYLDASAMVISPEVAIDHVEFHADGLWVATAYDYGEGIYRAGFQLPAGVHQLTAVVVPESGANVISGAVQVEVFVDTDYDGMGDTWETAHGLDPNDYYDRYLDNDHDGISNLDEFLLNFDPTKSDSDNDGIPDTQEDRDGDGLKDVWEFVYFGSPIGADPDADDDNDGLTNIQEQAAGTQPQYADSDYDGLLDGWEVAFGFNPLQWDDNSADPDNDGVTNYEESVLGLNPFAADSDSDGIPDAEEDQDNDGLPDVWEIRHFGSLASADENTDSDNDGMTDAEELAWALDPFVNDHFVDRDADGFPDVFEIRAGTDPTNAASRPTAQYIVDGTGAGTHLTIQDALNAVTDDYTVIEVRSGTYAAGLNLGSHRLLIFGSSGLLPTIIDGDQQNVGAFIYGDCYLRNLVVTNCAGTTGAAIYSGSGYVEMVNCIFSANQATEGGGAIVVNGGTLKMTHCTLFDNVAPRGSGVQIDGGSLEISNSILWDQPEVEEIASSVQATVNVRYSNLQHLRFGQGNISLLPHLLPDGHVRYDSPCIGRAEPSAVAAFDIDGAARPKGGAADIGADEFDSDDDDGDGLSNGLERDLGLDANSIDTDGDGISDGYEVAYGLNPLMDDAGEDWDNDGLSNLVEFQVGSNPYLFDTDGDGLSDGFEHNTSGHNPVLFENHDIDGDIIPTIWEIITGTNPLVDDSADNADGDDLARSLEYLIGRNWNVADSPIDSSSRSLEVFSPSSL